MIPINYLNPKARKKLGDTSDFNIVPIGFSSSFEEYHALGVQQPKHMITFTQMRAIAEKNVWVEAAIRAVCDTIGGLTYQIVPKRQYLHIMAQDEKMQKSKAYLEWLFTLQNSSYMTFSDVRKAVVRDLLIMDGGVIELIRTQGEDNALIKDSGRKGRIVGLMARDATTVYIDYDEHQMVRRYVQVGMKGRQAMPMAEDNLIYNIDIGGSFAVFDRNDIIYMRLNPKSGSAYGSPPIVTLLAAIQADLAADANIGRFMATGGIVPGFIGVDESLDPNVVKRYEDAFRRIQKAGAREIPIISGAGQSQFVPIAASSKEMEQNQLQNYYMKKILAIYKVPPHILGLTEGVNRSLAFAQNDNFYAGAINPIKVYLEEMLTERVVAEFDHRLRFEFLEPNATDKQSRWEEIQLRKQLGMIDDDEMWILAGIEPTQKENGMRILEDLQQEDAKVSLELKKLQIAQLAQGLEAQKVQFQQQQQMQVQQQQAQQQQAQEQQKMEKRQRQSDQGGVSTWDAFKQAKVDMTDEAQQRQKEREQGIQKALDGTFDSTKKGPLGVMSPMGPSTRSKMSDEYGFQPTLPSNMKGVNDTAKHIREILGKVHPSTFEQRHILDNKDKVHFVPSLEEQGRGKLKTNVQKTFTTPDGKRKNTKRRLEEMQHEDAKRLERKVRTENQNG